ncbi:retinitis pigmentosa 1-like 1 protein [Acipenser ruthenus]|uniref:retinitis pigmentosa 1-like 1 protein n=1 Tax=Acipenser ruthenus TaxID=7906 RepID=UPI002741BBA6|nr:retinitis pigmentosa 1-like 1 protein [Acipenser ruthenus]XP_058879754.1 retinitis pigmentosa 1-like 1 protein [Acipenser ruthenus]XP_058879755.1 retinitis pigmentosa 1-like 1 protein [Acipenser ruthenus]
MQSASLDYSGLTFPFNNDQPLPPVSRTATNVTESTPAKKITFFKRGDPQFSGVRMAIHKRSFKCFDALLDDLSHKVPLPFGVRTITTPRGTHCINRLEQLEDGGCYLCSDRWQVKPISVEAAGRKPTPWQSSRPASSRRRPSRLEELPGKHAAHRHPKRITLVKNSDPAVRRTIILNKITARSLKVFLEEISELLQYTIRRLYTQDGRKIDSIQALMQCPSVVVCVGREPFRPFLAESLRKNSEEKLPGLGAKSWTSICSESHESKKNVNFGLETKKSIIHPRSDSSNRSMRFSLSSEKSLPNMSPRNSGCASYEDTFPHAKESMMDEDIEKRVVVNKDGSLSVEMKVRFRLLNDETLQWSTQIKKSSFTNKDSCLEKEDEMGPIQQTNSEACSGVQAFCPCDTESYCPNCCNHCQYDIWKNPMHAAHSRQEGIGAVRHITSSSSSASSHRRIIHKKSPMDSFHTTSSEEYTEHVVEQAMCYAETVEEGDARAEYCTLSRCCSHGESCSTVSHKAARPETSSVNSKCISCPSPVENCESTAVTPISDNEEKRPTSIPSTSSKGSGNDTISVQITEITEEDERPNSTSSTSSKVLEALKEENDDNGDDRPPSSISRDSSQSKNCKKVKNESKDEERSRSVASSCSTTSCKKSLSNMHHLSPRPISKASSSSTRSNRSRKKKACVDQSDDARCLSIVSSLPNCSIKEPTEEEEHQSAGSSDSTSSKLSKASKSSKILFSESDKVTTPRSSVSETPAGQETAQAEEENDERPISKNVSIKASGKSKKSNKFLCSGYETATTPESSASEGPAGQETAQEAEDASSGRPVSNMSVSTRGSGKSKKSNKMLRSGSERVTTPGSSVSVGAACKEMKQDAEDASSGRPVSNMSISTRTSGKSKKSNKRLHSGSERATTPGSPASDGPAGQEIAQEAEDASSQKSNKLLYSESERETTPGSPVSLEAACEVMKEDAENASCGRPMSGMSVTKASGKSKVCKICQEDCREKAPSVISSSSKGSAHMKKGTSSHVGDDVRPPSKESHFSLSCCEHGKEGSSKLSRLQKSDSNHSEPFSVSETKEVTVDPEEKDERPLSDGSKNQSKESKCRKAKASSTSSSRPVSTLSSQSGASKAKINELNLEEDDERPQSKISSVYSYLQVKCNGIKSTDPKTDDEGANSVMSRSTRYRGKGSKKHMEEEDSSRISAPLSVSSQSLHSPCPPKGKPSKKNVRPKVLLGSSEGSVATESVSAAELLRENAGNSRPATTESVSEKLECSRNNKGCKNKKSKILKKNKEEDSEQILDAKELVPSALPNATPTEVVHEWLRKIPADTSMYELGDDFQEECEEPVITQHQGQISTEPTLATSAAKEVIPEEEEPKKELEMDEEKFEVKNTQDGENVDVEQCAEEHTKTVQATANEPLSSAVPTFPNKEALPNSLQTSVQVMKVLLNPSQGTKLDRCNSLPEVSATYGRKLSNSAKELLNCFVNLQLSEKPVHSEAKASSARYKELMNILQSLWFGGTSEDGQQTKLEKTFKDHQSTDDEFNPRSSSGVDVSSGSAGSGKSSITGGVEVIQSQRKAALPITQMNAEGSVTPTRHDSLHRLLEENKINEDDQHSGHSTPKSKLNARWAAVFSNSATPDIASRVQWSHESEGTGSEEDKEQKHIGEEDTESGETAEITKEEKEEPNKNEDESRSVKSPQETETHIQEEETSISEKGAISTKGNSSDPDPVWVLNLLKKLEKQFMTHYMNAVSDFKVKWNLDSSEQLDIMINDLKEEVHTRIQTTINRELKKIQGRAGRIPHPPGNTITRESTARTEQRRRRWKVMNRRSVEGSIERSDKNYTFSGTEFSEQRSEDEYCPCDTCMKKKMIARPAQPVVSTSVYIRKEYDLRQILCMRKNKPVEQFEQENKMGGNEESCTAETDNGCAEEQEEMENADNEENQEVAEEEIQEENSEAGKEEGESEETAENDSDEAQAEDEDDEADKLEVDEEEKQEENSEAGNEEGGAEETAENDGDEAQAEEEDDEAEKLEVAEEEKQEENSEAGNEEGGAEETGEAQAEEEDDEAEQLEVVEEEKQEENSEAGNEEGEAEETAENDSDEAQAEEEDDEADKLEVDEEEKQEENSEAGNEEGEAEETAENDGDEAQAEEEDDDAEKLEVAEEEKQEENSEAGNEERGAEETAENDGDEAHAEEEDDEAEKLEVAEAEKQEENSEAGNEEGEAEDTAENDDDEAQAEEQDEAEKLEFAEEESQEEIDGDLEKQVVEEEAVEESEQMDKESSAENGSNEVELEEETEVTDIKDNEEALAKEDEDAVDEEKHDLENYVGGDEEATAEVNDEKHNGDKKDCEADAENQETEEEIQEDTVEKGQETEENKETQENEGQADEGGDVDAEDSDETEVQHDNNEEAAYKDEEVEDKDEKEEEQEDKNEEEKVQVTDQAEPGEQAEVYDEGNVASEKENAVTKECDQQQQEDETQGTGEDNEIEDNPQNENKESQESEEEEAFEKIPSEVHKSSEENEDNSAEEEEENTDTEGNETSQDKETVVKKSLFNQMTKSSIEFQQGSMEKSIDKGIVRDNKNENTTSRSSGSSGAKQYAESSSEEEERESGCDSPEGNQNNAASDSEKEEKTVTSDKNKSTNTEKPKESDIDQDEFDF